MNLDLAYALVGGLVGGLAGTITYLVKILVVSKDDRIDELVDERDYWRDAAIASGDQLPDYEEWRMRRHPPQRS